MTTVLNVQPPPVVMDQINQLDGRLDVVYRALSADDEKIAASWVRRFFEKVRTEDEKLLLAILRFYFHSRQVSPEAIDKMDFLVTLVGARRSLDDGRYLPRFPQELTKLFASLLGLVRRSPAPAAELTAAVKALGLIRKDIESCERFEDLTEKKILDSLRTVKHRLGPAYYDTNVLSAILEANLAAKNRFQTLYRTRKDGSSSRPSSSSTSNASSRGGPRSRTPTCRRSSAGSVSSRRSSTGIGAKGRSGTGR